MMFLDLSASAPTISVSKNVDGDIQSEIQEALNLVGQHLDDARKAMLTQYMMANKEAGSIVPQHNLGTTQISPPPSFPPVIVPPHNDTIPPEAYNGWLDRVGTFRTFISQVGRTGDRSADDVDVSYVTVRGSGQRGAVVLSPGQGISSEEFAELIFDLVNREDFSPVYVIDHRGQGRSTRLLSDAFRQHVDQYQDYVVDFARFIQLVTQEMDAHKEAQGRRFLQCHSMGCAVTLGYLLGEYYAQRPALFNAVAAGAPLIQPATDPLPFEAAAGLGKLLSALGRDEDYVPFRNTSFEANWPFGRATDRLNLHSAICVSRRFVRYQGPPDFTGLCKGTPTVSFGNAFIDMYTQLFNRVLGQLSTPMLIQQTGDGRNSNDDGFVLLQPQDTFCSNHAANCKLTRYSSSVHQIWEEKDIVRSAALKEVYRFFDSNSKVVTLQGNLPPTCRLWNPCRYLSLPFCNCAPCSHPASRC